MVRLVFWRLARTGLAVWALASAVFLLSHRDASAALLLAAPTAFDLGATHTAATPAQQLAAQRAVQQRLGLDRPLFYLSRNANPRIGRVQWHWNGRRNQYHRWAAGLLHGDWGTSFRTGQAVPARLRAALAYTLPLTGAAAVLAVLAALALAQRLAAAPWWQQPLRVLLTAVHALPLFVVALALLLVFANPEVVAWFPAYGLDQSPEVEASAWGHLATYLLHLVLPVAALTLTAMPELALQLDAALARELRTGYATTARAKGLAEPAVIRHHALRNALLPTIAQVTELLPALVAGAVVVEVVFALPGMGRLLAEAAAARDYPVLVGGVLLTGAARLLALLLADLLYFWADPRIRWQS
ncbi:ABC transporter permease subunit [Hymenobacter terricola]|uniref:ABC transporter permease subunit n=1 Tax=Hymenobacter terricola TaxID=2819236 RepID=UPI001B30A6C8|nr:ABC transporter permease subunit [Hymenobacter terricola]